MEVETARKSSHFLVLNDNDKEFEKTQHVYLSTALVEQEKDDSIVANKLRMKTASHKTGCNKMKMTVGTGKIDSDYHTI